MPSTTKNQDSRPSNFYYKHLSEIWIVSIGAMAVIVFLSSAFYFYDANKVEGPAPAIGHVNSQPNSEDLIADFRSDSFSNQGPILIHQFFGWSSQFAIASTHFHAVVSPNNTMWRYTVDGWQDISLMAEQNEPAQSMLQSVHPLIWTTLTLLGVLLLLVMASSENEVNKLVKSRAVVADPKK